MVGSASLLTFNVSQAQPLLVDIVMNLVGVADQKRAEELRASFPYGLLQSNLLVPCALCPTSRIGRYLRG